jgi:hypothetical protein
VCSADLEDELIRALGVVSVEQVVEAQGDLGSFRTLQKQPEWRGRTTEQQLRRFMGSGSGRKIRYARLLVECAGSHPGTAAARPGAGSCLTLSGKADWLARAPMTPGRERRLKHQRQATRRGHGPQTTRDQGVLRCES